MRSGVSVVIPNYNGQHLLERHLPSVLAAMRDDDELVIIDDCSTDESWQWLQKEFKSGQWKHGKKSGPVHLLHNEVNQRFAVSCNKAVERATRPLIFLINSDVAPHKDTITQLTTHFTDENVFAVGCLEYEQNDKTGKPVLGGKNVLEFKRGMFVHRRADNFETGETAWASGGSSMFDRDKWLALGGFDLDYYPAYWEDIDLSMRAKKMGWKVLFDADAKADHHHETTNMTAFGEKKMKRMSWQHANTFTHKHATLLQKLQYYLWQPYWWVKLPLFATQQLEFLFFVCILLISIVLRGYRLGDVPHGMAWDEAAIGYNGFAIAHSGRDEWLKRLPISFQSFGDYKAPLAIYINGVFTLIFGMNLWAVRLPFMLAGVMGVVGMMLLVRLLWSEWFPKQRLRAFPILDPNSAALLAGAFMSVSVWHLHYTRMGFESGMALTFLIWGVAGVVWLLHRGQHHRSDWFTKLIGLSSAGLTASSLYTYHSSKVVAPLLILTIGILFRRAVMKHFKAVLVWLVVLGLLLTPLAYDTLRGQGGGRFQQASIFGGQMPFTQVVSVMTQNFWAHLQPEYLIGGETPTLRHGSGEWGILYSTELIFILAAGIVFLYEISQQKRRRFVPLGLFYFAVSWTVIGILPAAIGVDVPHSNRMLLALPGFLLLTILGWHAVAKLWNNRLLSPAFLGSVLMIQLMLIFSYLNYYYTTFAAQSTEAFSDGYVEAMEYVKERQDHVDKVLFTSVYQQPYIYALFVHQISNYDYHNGALARFEFSDKVGVGELLRKNTLIVGTPKELDPDHLDSRLQKHVIYGSDGEPRFVIVETE